VRARAAFLLIAAFGGATAAGAQPTVTSPAPNKIEVTVYRDPGRGEQAMNLNWLNGFALISERRRVRLPAGESVVRFEGVAGGIVPQSAIVTGFPDGIMERNRDAYLLSPATLLDRSLGRRVHLRRTSATGQVREQEAVVRSSAAGGVVLETPDGIEALRCTGVPEAIVYDEVPAGLSAKPTLSVRTRASAPVEAEVTLSYLATGFDWQANYIAELSPDGRRMDLFAWLTLGSQDETSFPNADTQAVAGRINYTRAEVPPAEGGPLELRCWPNATTSDIPLEQLELYDAADREAIVVTGSRVARSGAAAPMPVSAVAEEAMVAVQEELGDLKLYRIPEPVTVAANSQKQVALLVREGVAVQEVYRTRLSAAGDDVYQPATRYLVTRNREQEGLGLPLPSGGLALFTQRDGRPFLVGQGRVEDRAVGDDVEIAFAASPSIQTRVERIASGPDNRWVDYRLTVTNDQNRAAQFEAELARPADTRLVPRTRLTERDGYPLWSVRIPANGTATLRYRVEQLGKPKP
jgi:hypothetical protein